MKDQHEHSMRSNAFLHDWQLVELNAARLDECTKYRQSMHTEVGAQSGKED